MVTIILHDIELPFRNFLLFKRSVRIVYLMLSFFADSVLSSSQFFSSLSVPNYATNNTLSFFRIFCQKEIYFYDKQITNSRDTNEKYLN